MKLVISQVEYQSVKDSIKTNLEEVYKVLGSRVQPKVENRIIEESAEEIITILDLEVGRNE